MAYVWKPANRYCGLPDKHRKDWSVLLRNASWDGAEQWERSAASTLYCPHCPTTWRSSAAYVATLPDTGPEDRPRRWR